MRPDKVIFATINLVISCDQNFASRFTQLAAHATTKNKNKNKKPQCIATKCGQTTQCIATRWVAKNNQTTQCIATKCGQETNFTMYSNEAWARTKPHNA